MGLMKRQIVKVVREMIGTCSGENPYNIWARGVIRGVPDSPQHLLTATWDPSSVYWPIVVDALDEAEALYVESLLRGLGNEHVPGVVMEFGVFEGRWLGVLADIRDKFDLNRSIYGLDSFQGLSEVSPDVDLDCWHKGQYKADFDDVYEMLRCKDRAYLHLVKGWFSESLQFEEIQSLDSVAFARIDCDLYQPTVEVLEYLGPRLADGAILVFDDWTWNVEKGETRAFAEWCPTSGFRFEFLASTMGHFYLKASKE
ncbi:MAG: TylF/MycF family methyltransferase [Alphaproteobacteria bacterium]|nr:TylF/MycF family methyltransferase [Alphaproteobacteria bacterium]